jgi:hypothetical protein
MMCREIAGRNHQFAPYGLALSKAWARRRKVNPVWYVDITPGHDWLMNPLNEMVTIARSGHPLHIAENGTITSGPFEWTPIAKIAPFIEQMGPTVQSRKEFWWEREWRHVGNLQFFWRDVVAAFAPEGEHESLTAQLVSLDAQAAIPTHAPPKFLDPRWGLERMIASLTDVSEPGPFTT